MQTNVAINPPASQQSRSSRQVASRGLMRKLRVAFYLSRYRLLLAVGRGIGRVRIVASACRSCYGHICSQSPKEILLDMQPVSPPGSVSIHCSEFQMCARTQGIKTLLATHCWVDAVDLKMFLAGFDAGEQFASRIGSENNSASLELRT